MPKYHQAFKPKNTSKTKNNTASNMPSQNENNRLTISEFPTTQAAPQLMPISSNINFIQQRSKLSESEHTESNPLPKTCSGSDETDYQVKPA